MTLRQAGAKRLKTIQAMLDAGEALNREIVAAHKRGLGPSQIAKEADVSRQHVHNILKGSK